MQDVQGTPQWHHHSRQRCTVTMQRGNEASVFGMMTADCEDNTCSIIIVHCVNFAIVCEFVRSTCSELVGCMKVCWLTTRDPPLPDVRI